MVTHSSKSLSLLTYSNLLIFTYLLLTFTYLLLPTYSYLLTLTYLLGFTYYLYFLYAVVKELGRPCGQPGKLSYGSCYFLFIKHLKNG